jgi:alanyl-tRNA synthetase
MTVLLYQNDPYCCEFDTQVVEIRGEWVVLDRTAFFPGGGGQDPDRGELSGAAVVEVKRQDGMVLHRAPGHRLAVGDIVRGTIDWPRRYDLMKGHTGEHLMFSCLSRASPGIELVKIAITPEKKSVVINGDLDWERATLAQRTSMDAIIDDLPVTERTVARGDIILTDARVKMDRVHGDSIRVVEIGEVDRAACAGLHVHRTGELGMLLITSLTSARPAGDLEVEFEVGDRARRRAVELSTLSLRASEALGASPRDLLSALGNLLGEKERAAAALRRYGSKALLELVPSDIGGVKLYSGIFEGLDRKTITEAATRIIKDQAGCILGTATDSFMLIVACHPSLKVNCVAILNEALGLVGGKGGGKLHFAIGGAPAGGEGEKAMVVAIAAMSKALTTLKV